MFFDNKSSPLQQQMHPASYLPPNSMSHPKRITWADSAKDIAIDSVNTLPACVLFSQLIN